MKTALALISATALMLSICCRGSGSVPSDTIPSESRLLRFTVPAAGSSETYGNTVYISDLTLQSEPLVMDVLPGDNEIELPGIGIFILTFLDVPFPAAESSAARSVAGAIGTIGCLEIVAAGLSSVPVNQSAGSTISLGTLSSDGSSIASAITVSELESGTGYSESQLRLIGGFDVMNIRSRNPDIDRNGLLDTDQGLDWSMYQRIVFFMSMDDYDFESATLDATVYPGTASFMPGDIWIHFDNNFIDPMDRPISMRVPESINMTIGGESTLDVPYYQTDDGGQFWFLVKNYNNDRSSTPPYNGKWALSVGNVEEAYVIENVRFNDDTWNYDGLYIPLIRIEKASDGLYGMVRWRWIRMEQDSFIAVDVTEAKDLGLVDGANIHFSCRQPKSEKPYFEALNAEIQDIDQDTIMVSVNARLFESDSLDLGPYKMTDANIEQHQASFTDINGNMYQFHYFIPDDPYDITG